MSTSQTPLSLPHLFLSLYPFLSSLLSTIAVADHSLGQRLATLELRHQGEIVMSLAMEREKPDCGEEATLVAGEKNSRSLRPSIARSARNCDGLGNLRSNCNKMLLSLLLLSSA
ncbi:hypothetical protein TIFTF001_036479 [Ficus carica]|uniref:Uncharacterized protein n=1 Tax=Ficus carica TaxID=3494 RepID=A0AA88E6X8_FICCA|nr:hypothetical protein TIFTF001_036479 [Ficus carica]